MDTPRWSTTPFAISAYWARSPTFSKTPTSTAITPPTTCIFMPVRFERMRDTASAHTSSLTTSRPFSVSLGQQSNFVSSGKSHAPAIAVSASFVPCQRPRLAGPPSRPRSAAARTWRPPSHAAPNSRPNLLGVNLEVTGTAYLQQDARVGACAQVAIWTGMRHMHARHGYNWVSVADITRLATPTAPDEATSLPAG